MEGCVGTVETHGRASLLLRSCVSNFGVSRNGDAQPCVSTASVSSGLFYHSPLFGVQLVYLA